LCHNARLKASATGRFGIYVNWFPPCQYFDFSS
jgi:hypothetical protein